MNTTIYSPKMKTSSGWQNQENIFTRMLLNKLLQLYACAKSLLCLQVE